MVDDRVFVTTDTQLHRITQRLQRRGRDIPDVRTTGSLGGSSTHCG